VHGIWWTLRQNNSSIHKAAQHVSIFMLHHTDLLVSIEVFQSDNGSHLWMQSTWVKSKCSTLFFGQSFASMLVRVIIIQALGRNN
jgi:hypothetical protein